MPCISQKMAHLFPKVRLLAGVLATARVSDTMVAAHPASCQRGFVLCSVKISALPR